MNRNTSRKFVLTLSFLLTLLCLPLTAMAKDFMAMTPVSPGITEENSVGFNETDPSEYSFKDVVTVQQTSRQLVSAGFSETDPANSKSQNHLTALHTSISEIWQMRVGFDEIDPSVNSEQLFCLEAVAEEKTIQISQVFSSTGIRGQ